MFFKRSNAKSYMKDIFKNELGLLVAIPIGALLGFYRYIGIDKHAPLVFGTIFLPAVIYTLWSWRNQKLVFVKRCFLAFPIALLLAIAIKFIRPKDDYHFPLYVGIGLFLILTIKTPNWKMHFLIISVLSIFCMLLSLYYLHGTFKYRGYIIGVASIPICHFYFSYLLSVLSQKPVKFRYVLALAGTTTLAVFLLLLSYAFRLYYNISFKILFIISCLIGLGLWLVFRYIIAKGFTQVAGKKAKQSTGCDCCDRIDISQELLFKIDSGQQLCAHCLKEMDGKT